MAVLTPSGVVAQHVLMCSPLLKFSVFVLFEFVLKRIICLSISMFHPISSTFQMLDASSGVPFCHKIIRFVPRREVLVERRRIREHPVTGSAPPRWMPRCGWNASRWSQRRRRVHWDRLQHATSTSNATIDKRKTSSGRTAFVGSPVKLRQTRGL